MSKKYTVETDTTDTDEKESFEQDAGFLAVMLVAALEVGWIMFIVYMIQGWFR